MDAEKGARIIPIRLPSRQSEVHLSTEKLPTTSASAQPSAVGRRRRKILAAMPLRRMSLPIFRVRRSYGMQEQHRQGSLDMGDEEIHELEETDQLEPLEPLPDSDSMEDTDSIASSQSGGLATDDTSSGCSSQQVAKSAPCTPHGDRDREREGLPPSYQHHQQPPQSPRSTPSHTFARHHDRQTLKQLSSSAPTMTHHQQQTVALAAAAAAAEAKGGSDQPAASSGSPEPPGSSKSRQKKFHRHFKQVADEEFVLNYYSCALVGDILLQGHLYITKNYFAFYSNVFGYVTKLLIPTVSVTKISKEKTAYIIPNAVGVVTDEGKHVFGSLLSRDSTHRLMMQVWKASQTPQANLLPIEQVIKDDVDSASGDIKDDDDSSISGSDRSGPPPSLDCGTDGHADGCTKLPNGSLVIGGKHIKLPVKSSPKRAIVGLPRSKLLLIVSTGLLVLLFLSAAFLLYRISKIHSQFTGNPLLTTRLNKIIPYKFLRWQESYMMNNNSDEVYQEILKWQSQLHSRSANEVQEFLNSNLDQLAKVRQSLEALSLLIVSEGEQQHRQQQRNMQQQQQPVSTLQSQYKKPEDSTGNQQTSTLPHDKHS